MVNYRLLGVLSILLVLSNTGDSAVGLKQDVSVPVIKFLVCHSWGYKQAFEEYAKIIQQRYSEVKIEGGNYPPPTMSKYIATIISLFKFSIIFLLISGRDPFQLMGTPTPEYYQWAKENKVYACFMLFFVGNAIETQLTSTGAFEILLNDNVIWSKINSGRVPRVDELMNIIDNNIQAGNNFN